VYDNLAGDPQVDKNVTMDEKAHVFTLAAHYRFSEKLNLTGDISYTKSEGDFDPNNDDLLEPVSIASFSELDRRDFILHLGGEYYFENGLTMGLDYRYGDLDDKSGNIYDSVEDGEAHIISLNASKKW
jgi:predicted porin